MTPDDALAFDTVLEDVMSAPLARERFFARLSGSATLAQRRMFRRAQQATTKMLAALPGALPTVDARSLHGRKNPS
jgi:hypothetical protein